MLRGNLALLDSAVMITVTAPGEAEGLVFDRDRCEMPGPHRCSGSIGCKVDQGAADLWNGQAERSFSRLHRTASMRARRSTGEAGLIMAAKAWEPQQRGVAHLHMVCPYGFGNRRLIDAYGQALEELAPRYGFGFVKVQLPKLENGGARVAGYCAKTAEYVAKGAGTSDDLPIRRPFYVSRMLTTETLITMRMCRLRRWAWWLLASNGADWETIGADSRDPRSWLHLLAPYLANPPPSPASAEST